MRLLLFAFVLLLCLFKCLFVYLFCLYSFACLFFSILFLNIGSKIFIESSFFVPYLFCFSVSLVFSFWHRFLFSSILFTNFAYLLPHFNTTSETFINSPFSLSSVFVFSFCHRFYSSFVFSPFKTQNQKHSIFRRFLFGLYWSPVFSFCNSCLLFFFLLFLCFVPSFHLSSLFLHTI